MANFTKFVRPLVVLIALSAVGCDNGGGDDDGGDQNDTFNEPLSLNQAAYNSLTGSYQYGYRSIPNIKITGAPDDVDWNRWAMLHDGSTYRLYFFKSGSSNTLYQFGFNSSSSAYEFGHNSIPQLDIVNAPADADTSGFAMLHDGSTYRLYMRSKTSIAIHQFGYNPSTQDYEYGYNSIPKIDVTGGPADTDYDRWAMLHDGTTYRFYAFKGSSNTTFYQFGYNPSVQDYVYGHNSIPTLTVQTMPDTSDTGEFAMLHDGANYRFYFLTNE